jgi:hypothetical protein
MNGRDKDIAAALSEYAALPAADRKAVDALLSAGERRALEKLMHSARKQPARSERRDAAAPFSPWMAKRLKKLVDPHDRPEAPRLTQATHEVLSSLLARQAAR